MLLGQKYTASEVKEAMMTKAEDFILKWDWKSRKYYTSSPSEWIWCRCQTNIALILM